jgi:hypothetical protein
VSYQSQAEHVQVILFRQMPACPVFEDGEVRHMVESPGIICWYSWFVNSTRSDQGTISRTVSLQKQPWNISLSGTRQCWMLGCA